MVVSGVQLPPSKPWGPGFDMNLGGVPMLGLFCSTDVTSHGVGSPHFQKCEQKKMGLESGRVPGWGPPPFSKTGSFSVWIG